MTRDEARQLWKDTGLNYSNIGQKQVDLLIQEVDRSLLKFVNLSSDFTMKVRRLSKNGRGRTLSRVKLVNGSVEQLHIKVAGYIHENTVNQIEHFNDRQGISFENDGFIGFAGWADSYNVFPFLEAFENWITQLSESKAEYDERTTRSIYKVKSK